MAIIEVNFISKCLMRTVTFNAIIPVDKFGPQAENAEQKPLKTLYLLHGIFGNYTDWVNGTRIQAWAEANDLAVIMPSGENRFYLDDEKSGELYGEFIGKELVEFTRKLFPLSDKREDTFIAGLSMGGYGAIRNGLKYAENFGCVIGLSAALVHDTWKDADNSAPIFTFRRNYYETIFGEYDKVKGSDKDPKALLLKLKEEGRPVPKMYLCCGTEDGLVTANRDFRDFLNENGVDLTYVEGPGKHDWVFWDTYIKKVLDWLPLNRTGAGINSGNVK
ncbi:alpha/beta hydrolase family protein [Neglectibacter sp. CSJ-5]|uniref:alpha/beta hydrolase n=1 Tax=Neglectibacter sp. CSJ-5 TaxID=3078043 RepID=UPI0029308279|nr:alpha/beta hydrolase family protein [Neglectibacter sp. CSJ-5]